MRWRGIQKCTFATQRDDDRPINRMTSKSKLYTLLTVMMMIDAIFQTDFNKEVNRMVISRKSLSTAVQFARFATSLVVVEVSR